MIAVLGAGGKTGRALIAALQQRGLPVRALVRDSARADALRSPHVEPLIGDITRADDLARLFAGANTCYHICPNMAEQELEIGRSVIAAARTADLRRFVFHSVLHPQTAEMAHHWQKMRVEALLFRSGLDFTILQPAAYMQNVLAGRDLITARGEYRVSYALSTRIGMVDLLDVAEVAARVLSEDGHAGATYELATGERLSQHEVAAQLGRALGRSVRAVEIPRAEWELDARRAGLPDYAVRTLLSMFVYYESHGFAGNATVLRHLLGREPATFADFAARELRDTGPR